MNFYFELAECVADPKLGRYFVARDIEDKEALLHGRYIRMIRESERVWSQDNDTVTFLKNRSAALGADAEIDEDEFLLVILRSREV
jgi:hypothetical protein